MKNIVFIGAPGSGKGTQSSFIIRDYGIVQISTGDILRAAVTEGTELGKTAKKCMDEGKLVEDSIIIGIMKDRLKMSDCKNGFILDGFPRTKAQAEALDAMLEESLNTHITHVIYLDVPDEVIYDRITGRRLCPSTGKAYHIKYNPPKVENKCDETGETLIQRSDDTIETVAKRLNVFHETTELIVPLYERRGILLRVKGIDKPDEIYKKIKEFIDDIS